MITWQFMETAPKRGEILVVCGENGSGTRQVVHLAHWMPGGHCIEDHPPIDAGWYRWSGCSMVTCDPIAWAPYNAPVAAFTQPKEVPHG